MILAKNLKHLTVEIGQRKLCWSIRE